ncbi:gluconokinase [Aureimonas sp. AU40]|uniref:gluconokinase n=1 Tax=Aureimonas sp. AU40 TaxID=1637747 RepID=UPI000ABBBBED|nr:gluconokinase [Aureimonas sp. AU40]
MPPTASKLPVCLVVMGPSGTGKTTTAKLLSQRLGWKFAEADEFHPKSNIAKMSAGIALDDEDRAPWLASIRDWISDEAGMGESTVITCSALKRRYRDVLRGAEARVRFVELSAPQGVIGDRLAQRKGHYMPPSLFTSQYADFEPLSEDEDGVRVSVEQTPEGVVTDALRQLDLLRPELFRAL